MNRLQYKRGQLVLVHSDGVIWISNSPPKKGTVKVRVLKVHPEEENPYDVVISAFEGSQTRYEGVCGDEAIIKRIVPKCKSCKTEMVWHDKRKRRVCLFCDIDG